MAAMKHLATIKEVIDTLGGQKAVAQLTGRKGPVIPMWVMRGNFPTNTYCILKAALRKKGASAPDHLWNMGEATKAKAS